MPDPKPPTDNAPRPTPDAAQMPDPESPTAENLMQMMKTSIPTSILELRRTSPRQTLSLNANMSLMENQWQTDLDNEEFTNDVSNKL